MSTIVCSAPSTGKPYRDYREELRRDFRYACNYCRMTEAVAAGVGFEIDHYSPRRHDPANEHNYANLYWSCRTCNRHKDEYRPGHEGRPHLVRQDIDDYEDHIEYAGDVAVGRSEVGRTTIAIVFLNRLGLRDLRREFRIVFEEREQLKTSMSELRRISIDRLPPRERGAFERARRAAITQLQRLERLIWKFQGAADEGRSSLLDADQVDPSARVASRQLRRGRGKKSGN